MKTLQDFYNKMTASSESMESGEIDEFTLLELSAEAISHSAREIEKGIDLVLSLESMAQSLDSDLSLESEEDFVESLESLLSHSGLDIPVDFFVSFEAEETDQGKVTEAKKEETKETPEDKEKPQKKRINVKDTKEKIKKGAEKIKAWLLEKAKEFSKWLETRIATLEQTSAKLLSQSDANGKVLATINTRSQAKTTDDEEEEK